MELPPERFRALPTQLIPFDRGLVLQRGGVELQVVGERAAALARTVLRTAEGGATSQQLEELFPPGDRAAGQDLIRLLVRHRFLVPDDGRAADGESPAAVFFWQLGTTERQAGEKLGQTRVLVLGRNLISRRLIECLQGYPFSSVELADVPELRRETPPDARPAHDPSRIDPEAFDCFVATAAGSGFAALREWNEYCHLHRRPFLPVFRLDGTGFVGPLFVPGETPCLECFRLRRLTHTAGPAARRAADTAGGAVSAWIAPAESLLGELACLELLKFLGAGLHAGQPGAVVEVDPFTPVVRARPVLKLPRCPVCTPLAERPLTSAPVT